MIFTSVFGKFARFAKIVAGQITASQPTTWTSGDYDVTVGSVQFGSSPLEFTSSYNLQYTGIRGNGVLEFGPGGAFSTSLSLIDPAETAVIQHIEGVGIKPVGAAPPDLKATVFYVYDPSTTESFIQFGSSLGNSCLIMSFNNTTGKKTVEFLPTADGFFKVGNLRDFASDTAAGAGGVTPNDFYYTTATVPTADIAVGDRILKVKS